ncbi:MAG: pantoate--beta-alanine ligase [Proteobacteria bacterium]|nr:pantoate--beta-alanine ligase [Pseudomonadota bacterium]
MLTFHHQQQLKEWRKTSSCARIAFVPTMGSLHQGHSQLISYAQSLAETTVVSIYVNPLQFHKSQDFDHYPRPLQEDLHLLSSLGVDGVYIPSSQDPITHPPLVDVSCPQLAKELCGKYRPGHFSGVCVIILKFLHIIQPNYLVMGKKDFQQYKIIETMINHLHIDVNLTSLPTVRDKNQLALSSRLKRLSEQGKKAATKIFPALKMCKQAIIQQGIKDTTQLLHVFNHHIATANIPTKVEYLSLNHIDSLQPVTFLQPVTTENFQKDKTALFVCVHIEEIRLIDHLLLSSSE